MQLLQLDWVQMNLEKYLPCLMDLQSKCRTWLHWILWSCPAVCKVEAIPALNGAAQLLWWLWPHQQFFPSGMAGVYRNTLGKMLSNRLPLFFFSGMWPVQFLLSSPPFYFLRRLFHVSALGHLTSYSLPHVQLFFLPWIPQTVSNSILQIVLDHGFLVPPRLHFLYSPPPVQYCLLT